MYKLTQYFDSYIKDNQLFDREGKKYTSLRMVWPICSTARKFPKLQRKELQSVYQSFSFSTILWQSHVPLTSPTWRLYL